MYLCEKKICSLKCKSLKIINDDFYCDLPVHMSKMDKCVTLKKKHKTDDPVYGANVCIFIL